MSCTWNAKTTDERLSVADHPTPSKYILQFHRGFSEKKSRKTSPLSKGLRRPPTLDMFALGGSATAYYILVTIINGNKITECTKNYRMKHRTCASSKKINLFMNSCFGACPDRWPMSFVVVALLGQFQNTWVSHHCSNVRYCSSQISDFHRCVPLLVLFDRSQAHSPSILMNLMSLRPCNRPVVEGILLHLFRVIQPAMSLDTESPIYMRNRRKTCAFHHELKHIPSPWPTCRDF